MHLQRFERTEGRVVLTFKARAKVSFSSVLGFESWKSCNLMLLEPRENITTPKQTEKVQCKLKLHCTLGTGDCAEKCQK